MDEAREEGIGGNDDRSIMFVSLSIIEVALETLLDWLNV